MPFASDALAICVRGKMAVGTLGIGWGWLGSVVTGGVGQGRRGESVLIPGDWFSLNEAAQEIGHTDVRLGKLLLGEPGKPDKVRLETQCLEQWWRPIHVNFVSHVTSQCRTQPT